MGFRQNGQQNELYDFLISLQTSVTFYASKVSGTREANKRVYMFRPKIKINYNQKKADKPIIGYKILVKSNNNINVEFENLLEEEIFIAPTVQEYLINSIDISVRLENVLRSLEIEKLGDLHGMSFRQIFHTKNCGRKSIFELRDLIEKIQQNESIESFRKIERIEDLELEKIHIQPAVRDLPISFLVEQKELRENFYTLKIKTLGDLQNLPIEKVKKNRNIDEHTFSKLQELIENAQNGGFDKYLEGEQSEHFVRKLISRLHRKISIPENIKDISVERIGFSTRLAKALHSLNVGKLGDLENFTFDNLKSAPRLGKDSVFELWQFVASMQKNAGVGKNSFEELEADSPAETVLSELSLNGVLKFINDFVSALTEREQEVLFSRLGGAPDERILTLEELGEKFQVTRERIRQMESNSLKKLKTRLSGISENALEKIKVHTEAAVCPLTARFLIHLTENDYALFACPPNFYLHLLKKLAPEIYISAGSQTPIQSTKNVSQLSRKIKNFLDEQPDFLTLSQVFEQLSDRGTFDGFGINDFFEAIRSKKFIVEDGDAPNILLIASDKNKLSMAEMARQVLTQSEQPLTPEEIIAEARKMFGEDIEFHSERSLANLPSFDRSFYLLNKRTIGLRQHFHLPEPLWNQVKDDFHKLLLEKKRPVSTTEVINKNLFDWTSQTNPSETTEILREDERFKDLGRFLFALNEWQIEEREPVKDLVIRVLQESDAPLTAMEIGNNVQKYRSVATTSMPTVLRGHSEIQTFDFGYYGLKSKGNYREFFTTNEKFLKRLVKTLSPVTFDDLCQKLDLEVNEDAAQKMWRTLRSLNKLRFAPVYRSAETVITFHI